MDLRLLTHLSEKYPNMRSVSAEIINLNAILALPKGTEFFFSDLHGEHEAFIHMLKSASGVVRTKVDEVFGPDLSSAERENLAILIYNAQAEINRRKKTEKDFDRWCRITILRLVEICKSVFTKYTRSKVRKRLPKYWDYSMDELLHSDDETNKAHYYSEIINAVIECDMAEEYIIKLSYVISTLAVDRLHIIGDIYDRGAHPDYIMDFLMDYHDVDIQWGNHDVLWMGAACGNWPCIANVLRANISYNNIDMLEVGYGISLRNLAYFANKVYGDDSCEYFMPHVYEENKLSPIADKLVAKMNKAIAICQFKIEGQQILNNPKYELNHRLLLDKINFEKGTVNIKGVDYELRDTNFPTIDPNNPYELTDEEKSIMKNFEASFRYSEKLQKHVKFLYSHGAMYKKVNGNLLYHGCVPMNEDGSFKVCEIDGLALSGKEYLDYLDSKLRKIYFSDNSKSEDSDLMWLLWLIKDSPLFGKDQMTTFERCFVADKKTHKEHSQPYYKLIHTKESCMKILDEFGLDPQKSHILTGHIPVKIKDGESPIRGCGKLFIIDGGMSKAYQKQTGIAGYTFIYNSRFMALAEHKPYSPLRENGTQKFSTPKIHSIETFENRISIKDTDVGKELVQQMEELKALRSAYKKGLIKERDL